MSTNVTLEHLFAEVFAVETEEQKPECPVLTSYVPGRTNVERRNWNNEGSGGCGLEGLKYWHFTYRQ